MSTRWFSAQRSKQPQCAPRVIACLSCGEKAVIEGTVFLPTACSGCGADLYCEEILFLESLQSDLVRTESAA